MKVSKLLVGALLASVAVTGVANAQIVATTITPTLTTTGSPAANNARNAIFGADGFIPTTSAVFWGGTVPADVGTASATELATFTLTGTVSQDCSIYSGGQDTQTISLGTLGIQAGDNVGLASAFDLAGAIHVDIDTSVAGCNYANNKVTIAKVDLYNATAAAQAYDSNQFSPYLPTNVDARWTGVANSGVGQLPTLQDFPALVGNEVGGAASGAGDTASLNQGAFKSQMFIEVDIPVPTKSPLAGSYTGSVTVTLGPI